MNAKLDSSRNTQPLNALLVDAEVAEVQKILADELAVEPDQITPEAKLKEDLGADSIDQVSIIMRLEERFNTTISDEDAETVQTVGDLCETLAHVLGRGRR